MNEEAERKKPGPKPAPVPHGYSEGHKIGRIRCIAPICGKEVNVSISKTGKAHYICPHCDAVTLERCNARVFFGMPATLAFIAAYEAAKGRRRDPEPDPAPDDDPEGPPGAAEPEEDEGDWLDDLTR